MIKDTDKIAELTVTEFKEFFLSQITHVPNADKVHVDTMIIITITSIPMVNTSTISE